MSSFFFISTYDNISAEIISALINTHPDIKCQKKISLFLLPKIIDSSIDEYIEINKTDKKFNGNIKNFFPLEFDLRNQAENITNPFIVAHISVAPALRIKFLLSSWLNLGFTPEVILNQLEEQINIDLDNENSLLNIYQFNYFYQNIIKFYHEQQRQLTGNATPINHSIPAYDKLFLIALALVLSFDANNLSRPEATFKLEALLANQTNFTDFIKFIIHDNITFHDDFFAQYKEALLRVDAYLKSLKFLPWEPWQTHLLDFCLKLKVKLANWPQLDEFVCDLYQSARYFFTDANSKKHWNVTTNSRFFTMMNDMEVHDRARYRLANDYLVFHKSKTYYFILNVTLLDHLEDKNKLFNEERIKLITKLVKEKNGRIIFDLTHEALTVTDEPSPELLSLHRILEEIGLPGDRIYLMCSNSKIAEHYPAWADKHKLSYRINVLGTHYYMFVHALNMEKDAAFLKRKEDLMRAAKRTVENNELRPKYFMCLNFGCREHRSALLLFFFYKNYLDKAIVTYYASPFVEKNEANKQAIYAGANSLLKKFPEKQQVMAYLEQLDAMRPIVYDKNESLDFNSQWKLDYLVPEARHHGEVKRIETYFEITTETYFLNGQTLNLTEKCIRPIARFQIFLIAGSPYTLKYLRDVGFQTFSPYIDESYDEIENPSERLMAIMKETERLCSLSLEELHQIYCALWPRIMHNFNHLTTNFRSIYKAEVDKLFAVLSHETQTNKINSLVAEKV